tara:strand:+ start:1256 stop:2446 length:1191 start_codon:yes stop_codon:yes gene_type:complete
MAVSFIQQPTTPNGTQATIVYSLTGLTLQDQAKYICDVKTEDGVTQLVRIKQPSNESNFGVFEISDVLHDYTDWDEVWTTPTIVSSSNNNTRTFSIEFGEEYGTSPSSSLIISESQVSQSLTVYPAVEELVAGLNWQSGSYFNDFLSNSPATQSVRLEDYGTLSHFNLSNSFVQSYRVTIFNESNSILAQKFFTDTYSGSNDNEGSKLVHYPTGPQNFINDATLGSVFNADNWSYYTVVANTNEGDRRFNKLNSCIAENGTRFGFINKVGTWDYYTAALTKTETQTYNQDTFEQEFVNYSTSDGSVAFDKARRGTTIYNKAIQKNFGAQTDWLTTEESDWLLELFQSPSVYVQYEGGFVPVIITNTTAERKTNPRGQKLFTHRINYQYANKPKSRR